jgi:hypothetical protein
MKINFIGGIINMLNDEYELLLIDGPRNFPSVNRSSQIGQVMVAIKELYLLGEISKEDYVNSLMTSIESLGFTLMKIKKEA